MEKRGTKTQATVPSHSLSLLNSGMPIILGRPSTADKIYEIVGSTQSSDSTIVVACGPDGMMLDVTEAVARVVSAGTRSVSLHCQQFWW